MMGWMAAQARYESMVYRRCGRSGLKLPAVSLGLWHNFGGVDTLENARAMLRRAFDLGITHFDLANNYGPPPGSAEENFGRILRQDLRPYRDELIISSKAGYYMWPGPYGEWGSRKYLVASLRPEPEAHGAGLRGYLLLPPPRPRDAAGRDDEGAGLYRAQRAGAVRRHLLLQRPSRPARPRRSCSELGTPCLIHQPSYNMFNRWIEDGLLDVLEEEGIGCIAFSPLAQGLLTDRYLTGNPRRFARGQAARLPQAPTRSPRNGWRKVRKLNEIAQARGQTHGPDGDCLGAAPPGGHLGADRRQPGRADRGYRRRAQQPRLQRRRSWRRSRSCWAG